MTELQTTVAGQAWRDSAREFSRQIRALYSQCLSAYHAFDDLPRLVDGLRLLSVNAGLASARAGDYGRSIRVLTNFATEAVTRLLAVIPEMVDLKKRTYAIAGTIMRSANDIGKLEAAGNGILANGHRFAEQDPLPWLDRAWRARVAAVVDATARLHRTHQGLADIGRITREVMLQTQLVSANIAIEATSAGPYEAELAAVSESIRDRVEELRGMVDTAARHLRDASETIMALEAFGRAAGAKRGGVR